MEECCLTNYHAHFCAKNLGVPAARMLGRPISAGNSEFMRSLVSGPRQETTVCQITRTRMCQIIRGDHTKRQKLYVSVHGRRSETVLPANLPEKSTLRAVNIGKFAPGKKESAYRFIQLTHCVSVTLTTRENGSWAIFIESEVRGPTFQSE